MNKYIHHHVDEDWNIRVLQESDTTIDTTHEGTTTITTIENDVVSVDVIDHLPAVPKIHMDMIMVEYVNNILTVEFIHSVNYFKFLLGHMCAIKVPTSGVSILGSLTTGSHMGDIITIRARYTGSHVVMYGPNMIAYNYDNLGNSSKRIVVANCDKFHVINGTMYNNTSS